MDLNERATEFVIFCIENTAERLGVSGSAIYNSLESVDGISGFLYPSYKALHTQSKNYIIDEVLSYMRENNLNPKPAV